MERELFLVVDMQNVYGEGGQWYCPGVAGASSQIQKILRERAEQMDVIFTVFQASQEPVGAWKQYNKENEAVNMDPWSNEMMPEFSEYLKQFPCYEKSTYSSLSISEVKEAAKEATRVVVSGVVAECCVLATVMALIDEGVPVIYLTDAVAGIDADTEAAVERILSGLEPLHVRRMTTERYLSICSRTKRRNE